MTAIASAFVRVNPDMKGFRPKVEKDAREAGAAASHSFSMGFGKIAGAVGGVFAVSKAFSVMRDSISEATESIKVSAQTSAVLKSTGGAAGVTATQVGNLATKLSNLAGVDDELVQQGENVLLTFTNIRNEAGKGNDVFNQTTGLALDMSKALGQDLQSSVIQLGKALNDPVKGVTALQRVGVSFTESQKAQIAALVKSGNLLGAQKVVLAEVRKEFGGTAAAVATPAEKMQVAWKNLEEQLGTALMPALNKVFGFASKLIPIIGQGFSVLFGALSGNSEVNEFDGAMRKVNNVGVALHDFFVGSLVPAFKNVKAAIQPLLTEALSLVVGLFKSAGDGSGGFGKTIRDVTGFLKDHKTIVQSVAVALGTIVAAMKVWAVVTKVAAAAQVALNIALDANPIGIVVLAIAALAAGLIYAYKHSETFRNIVQTVGRVGKEVFLGLAKVAITVGEVMFKYLTFGLRAFLTIASKIPGPWRNAAKSALHALDAVTGKMDEAKRKLDDLMKPHSATYKVYIATAFTGQAAAVAAHKGDTVKFNAAGTNYFGGGWSWVGEQGPELMRLPRGTQIKSHPDSMAMTQGSGGTLRLHPFDLDALVSGLAAANSRQQIVTDRSALDRRNGRSVMAAL